MPTIQLHLSDQQYLSMQEHFARGGQLELDQETSHGFGFEVSGFAGLWFLKVDSQAGKIDLDTIHVTFVEE